MLSMNVSEVLSMMDQHFTAISAEMAAIKSKEPSTLQKAQNISLVKWPQGRQEDLVSVDREQGYYMEAFVSSGLDRDLTVATVSQQSSVPLKKVIKSSK